MLVAMFGWLTLGYEVENHRLLEPSGYIRPPIMLPRQKGSDQIRQINDLSAPWGAELRFGGMYDALHQGRCLVYWSWLPPWSAIPGSLMPLEVTFDWEHRIQLALNAASAGTAPDIAIAPGGRVGACNGQAMIAGVKLTIADGLLTSTAAVAKNAAAARRPTQKVD
jgi:hypothetical protein